MKDYEELDNIIGANQGTRGDYFPDDLTEADWTYIYEAIDTCDMCGHWEDSTEFDDRGYCGRCQCDYPIEDEEE